MTGRALHMYYTRKKRYRQTVPPSKLGTSGCARRLRVTKNDPTDGEVVERQSADWANV